MSRSHDVILSAQPGVQLDILKGSRNAEFSQLIRPHSGNSLSIAVYFTFLRFVEAINAVEEGGLAGTIRSDDSQYLVIPDLHAYLSKGTDTAKAEGEVINLQFNQPIPFQRSPSPAQWSFFNEFKCLSIFISFSLAYKNRTFQERLPTEVGGLQNKDLRIDASI
jgi:hypothetical protein